VKGIAAALLLGVFLRHATAFKIAQLTGWSAAGVFYVQGAALEILLLVLLFLFISEARSSVWRDLGITAVGIGIVEASLVAGCQMVITSRPPEGVTQCDHMTGLPVGAALGLIYVAILAWVAGRRYWQGE